MVVAGAVGLVWDHARRRLPFWPLLVVVAEVLGPATFSAGSASWRGPSVCVCVCVYACMFVCIHIYVCM
jgi:hypothetical protein